MNQPGTVYCLIGDGESNEGTIWESIMIAEKHKLNNLICIVDNNRSQTRSLPTTNLYEKFFSFGWNVSIVDGHDINILEKNLNPYGLMQPRVVIANTIKGKGVKDIEDNMFAWHHRAPNEEEYKKFVKEIDEA